MSNVLSEEQKQQVLALGRMGWSMRRIERETGIYRDTAARYLREAGITVKKPGRPGKETAKPAINAAEVIPGSAPQNSNPAIPATPGKPSTPSACEPFRDTIEEALSRGRNAKAIWQDMVDDHSFTGSYQSVRRFVRKHAGPVIADARAVIITPPGEEAQVDYGAGPLVRDPQSGKYHARGCSFSRSGSVANASAFCASNPAPAPGPNSTKRPSAGSAARPKPLCLTISGKAFSNLTFTTRI